MITNNEEKKNWIDFIRRYSVIVTSLAPFHIDLRTVNAHNTTETKIVIVENHNCTYSHEYIEQLKRPN